jgi:hypothetical protein
MKVQVSHLLQDMAENISPNCHISHCQEYENLEFPLSKRLIGRKRLENENENVQQIAF